MTARINLYVSTLLLNRMLAISKGADRKPAQRTIDGLIEDAKQAIEVYRLAGSLSGEFQVKLHLPTYTTPVGTTRPPKRWPGRSCRRHGR